MLFAAAAASASASANKTVPAALQDHQRIAGTAKAGKSIPSTVAAPAKVELMEAMKKLDANLVALFATAAEPSLEQLKQQKKQQQQPQLWSDGELPLITASPEQATPELFQNVNTLQLHLEALTLQAEGTKRMELLQNEVRPIFTVECQLSKDLIQTVPSASMHQFMLFESEKFQSLTQCTRFGQTQQRQVRLPALGANEDMGSVHFVIWWREPGTCLNEMLGMGILPLSELYEASLLEQCKCIMVQRRNQHLASLYVKISLQAKSLANENSAENSTTNNKNNKTNNHNTAAAANNESNNNLNAKACTTTSLSNNNDNRKVSLDSLDFMAETNKVRLLRGYIYASETRQLSVEHQNACQELLLQPFWQTEPLSVKMNAHGCFQLQEQFAIINDEKFLHSMERQQLQLELHPLGGQVKLPLHQFFIAYRDASITNHLCKGKLPVISIDGWTPILHAESQKQLGELKVLLAIGSETQITQLKQQRGFQPEPQRTTDLLDMLQTALTAPAGVSSVLPTVAAAAKPHAADSVFSFSLHIVGAAGLPLNPAYGKSGKKQAKRQAAAKRFPPNEPPNTYVSFQAQSCNAQTYKSHEGAVYATHIVERSTTPQWHSKFQVTVSADYLSNPQKLFILKLWKKTALSAGTEPTPLEDAIIGFAALNLNQTSAGSLPSGWHNIVDFNGRVTGGLELHVQALSSSSSSASAGTDTANVDNAIEHFEQSLELRHLQLGQAIKRKFTELEQISQRLRTRLVDVTGETLQSPQFDIAAALDNWQPDELQHVDDDELAADFERALRTPTPEATAEVKLEPTCNAQSGADAGQE